MYQSWCRSTSRWRDSTGNRSESAKGLEQCDGCLHNCSHDERFKMDRLLLACQPGCTLRGRCRQQRVSSPRSANVAPVARDCIGFSPTRACQVCGPSLSHFLAHNYGLDLAVSTRMGKACIGSLLPDRDSDDISDWRCLRDGNCLQCPVADGGELVGGIRCGGLIV